MACLRSRKFGGVGGVISIFSVKTDRIGFGGLDSLVWQALDRRRHRW